MIVCHDVKCDKGNLCCLTCDIRFFCRREIKCDFAESKKKECCEWMEEIK